MGMIENRCCIAVPLCDSMVGFSENFGCTRYVIDICNFDPWHWAKGQEDVALFKEAATIFHHNDLRIIPFCQPDELTPAAASVNPNGLSIKNMMNMYAL